MIEQLNLLPLAEKVLLLFAIALWLIAHLACILRQPVVDAQSLASAARQLRGAKAAGLLSIACVVAFGILHFFGT